MFNLDETYKVGGHSVIFLVDEYGEEHTFQDAVLLALADGKHKASYVSDTDVERARKLGLGLLPDEIETAASDEITEESPESLPVPTTLKSRFKLPSKGKAKRKSILAARVKLFGFWQTALHNNAVNLAVPLTIAPFSDSDDRSGLFIIVENGAVIHSGLYNGRYIPNAPVDISRAARLEINQELLRKWRIPSPEARTTVEIAKQESDRRSQRTLRMIGSAGISLALACVTYYLIDIDVARRQAEFNSTSSQAQTSEGQTKALKINKLSADRYPDGETVLSLYAILQLAYATDGLQLNWDDFNKPEFISFTAIASRPLYPLNFQHTRVIQPDGTYLYSWPRTQVAP